MAAVDFIGGRKILLVGGGNMGQALLKGWQNAGLKKENIVVAEKFQTIRDFIEREYNVKSVEPSLGTADFEVIVFAVKPAQMAEVLRLYGPSDSLLHSHNDDCIFISIAAGITLDFLKKYLGSESHIVRAMPNLPATIGEGITVALTGKSSSAFDAAKRVLTESIFRAVGHFEWVEDEELLNPITAISGSGPAYVFYLAECLMEVAQSFGIEENLAMELVQQTIKGSALMAYGAEKTVGELCKNVTSPGGTTEAAIDVLNRGNFKNLIKSAVTAACERAKALSQ